MSSNRFRTTSYNISSAVPSSKMDYHNNGVSTVTIGGYAGGLKAIDWKYLGHYEYKWELYRNGYSKFVFEIETGHNMAYNPAESDYFVFTTHQTVIFNNGYLECRYAKKNPDGSWGHHYPSIDCNINTNAARTQVTMKLHPYLDIVSN